ncbi:MAG: Bax inhibitor-1/YccA family protein [Myxococcaceae bacterium]
MDYQPAFATNTVDEALIQESQRAFMNRVYRWMFGALLVTGAVAMATATNLALTQMVARNFLPLTIATLGLVLALSWAAPRMSGAVAAAMFLAYSVLNGLFFSVLFYVYPIGTIGQAFLMTAGVFGALSVYGTVTKKDLSAWRTFLFIGLVGIILASVVNIFARNDMADFVISCAVIIVFAGLTAYDTQKLRQYHATHGYDSAMSFSIVGALMLYLDFINLFLAILRLLGRRR